ncbi:MAG: RusA family crossover junction endodeoxyribonuclease [Nitrososphaerota archaeon]|nr:RusA family crossover junction endodeoxyribonuclease [Nitrososphaerota archaeon]
MDRYKFEVRVPTKPMSGSGGKRRHERKEELIKAIREAKPNELETARRAFRDKRVKVSVRFNLEKPKEGSSNTVGKKDLDNMLKLVLDALQTKADSQGKLDGLGLIHDDDCIYRLEANKKLVDRPEQAGISISISEY